MSILHHLRLRQKLLVLTGLLCIVIGVLAVTQWRVNQAADTVAQAYQQRYTSYMLANELRRNSDDLTRLVRSYVDTGEARWEQQYHEVADIQAGKIARPGGYEGIYWDLRAAGIAVPGASGPTVALLELMRQADFSSAELAKLSEAASLSIALAQTEMQAIKLVKELPPMLPSWTRRASWSMAPPTIAPKPASWSPSVISFNCWMPAPPAPLRPPRRRQRAGPPCS